MIMYVHGFWLKIKRKTFVMHFYKTKKRNAERNSPEYHDHVS